MASTAFRTCPLCEATCGLELTVEGDEVVTVRGDADDVFSHGFICPKGVALKALHEDPDRLRTPLIRQPTARSREATWDEAFAEIDARLPPLLAEHGRDARRASTSATRAPTTSAALLYGRVLLKALGTRNVYTREHGRPDAEAGRARR